jgi:hypothetical protein
MKVQLIHKHWKDGGTVITNFTKADIRNYVDAVRIYNGMVGHTALVITASRLTRGRPASTVIVSTSWMMPVT